MTAARHWITQHTGTTHTNERDRNDRQERHADRVLVNLTGRDVCHVIIELHVDGGAVLVKADRVDELDSRDGGLGLRVDDSSQGTCHSTSAEK